MTFTFSPEFIEDVDKLKAENPKLLGKIWELLADITEGGALHGRGNPEKLKHQTDVYSRRIDQKHRLVYKVEKSNVHLHTCYGHYGDK